MAALVLDVRFLDDRYHGMPEWPPSPGRLFQALVAAAAQGGGRSEEADAALRWLERLPPPTIIAPPVDTGRGFTAFVPNNDGDAESDPAQPQRIGKAIRAHLLPEGAVVSYLWDDIEALPEAMPDLAHQLYQLGRGVDPAFASLRICEASYVEAEAVLSRAILLRPSRAEVGGVDCPTAGTLDSLDARFLAFRKRLTVSGRGRAARIAFANPPRPRFARVAYASGSASQLLLYDLRDRDGRFHAVDPTEAGLLIPAWLADAAARLGSSLEALAERFVIGRGAGAREIGRRVRAFPVPTVRAAGDRWIRRLALEIPAACPLRRADLEWAFQASEAFAARWGRPVPADDCSMLRRYQNASRLWQSETAVVLPVDRRRLASRGRKSGCERTREEAAARSAVVTALRHAGVLAQVASIRVQREPFAGRGARAEHFAGDARFPGEAKWHVEVGFAEAVRGPLLLGNGRFVGLGLMRPAADGRCEDILAFKIEAGLAQADAAEVALALRRAVLARAGDDAPPFITGHDPAGGPLREGRTTHVAHVADLERSRLLIVPPHRIDHRPAERADDDAVAVLRAAMAGFSELRAGPAGRLTLRPVLLFPDDPLLRASCHWESVTPYRVTRHPKGRTAEEILVEDVSRELRHRNLPQAEVTVLTAKVGQGGGISGHVRLNFAAAVEGPILLGRSRQKGGGLFVACGGAGEEAPPIHSEVPPAA